MRRTIKAFGFAESCILLAKNSTSSDIVTPLEGAMGCTFLFYDLLLY